MKQKALIFDQMTLRVASAARVIYRMVLYYRGSIPFTRLKNMLRYLPISFFGQKTGRPGDNKIEPRRRLRSEFRQRSRRALLFRQEQKIAHALGKLWVKGRWGRTWNGKQTLPQVPPRTDGRTTANIANGRLIWLAINFLEFIDPVPNGAITAAWILGAIVGGKVKQGAAGGRARTGVV